MPELSGHAKTSLAKYDADRHELAAMAELYTAASMAGALRDKFASDGICVPGEVVALDSGIEALRALPSEEYFEDVSGIDQEHLVEIACSWGSVGTLEDLKDTLAASERPEAAQVIDATLTAMAKAWAAREMPTLDQPTVELPSSGMER